MRMSTLKVDAEEYTVVLGPCPGCDSWQLDYTYAASAQFAEPVFDDVYEFGSGEPMSTAVNWDTAAFHEAVEYLLREHLDECPHLQRLLGQD